MKTKTAILILLAWTGTLLNTLAQPVIIDPPVNQTNCLGSTATFSVDALGTPPLSYHWMSGLNLPIATNLPGETNATLVLPNVQRSWRYGVVVTEGGGLSVPSGLASLQIHYPFGITQQPTKQALEIGSTFACLVSVTGLAPPLLQPYFNGEPLPGKTGTTLSIANVQTNNAGDYWVVVVNTTGAVIVADTNVRGAAARLYRAVAR
jgi:hypothetical protein